MTVTPSDTAHDPGRRTSDFKLDVWVPYIATALCIWLGWQCIQMLLAGRGPPALAVSVAPRSPVALGRAAEQELVAQRPQNAETLAFAALGIAPFDVRAMRIAGLATAENGDTAVADQILTLAGNWSLRDTPTHAWLVAQRLRQGSYTSAFAHADTIARRRFDAQPQIFSLFTTAALDDPRSIPVTTRLVGQRPPWRWAYVKSLAETKGGDAVLATMAVALKDSDGRLQNDELQLLFGRWLSEGRIPAIAWLRGQLVDKVALVENGDFSPVEGTPPFAWRLVPASGVTEDIVEDDLQANNTALRVEASGWPTDRMVEQLMLLSPGSYSFNGDWRPETSADQRGFEWSVRCFEDGREIGVWRTPETEASEKWLAFRTGIVVPASGCTAQWLQLRSWNREEGGRAASWFDRLSVAPAGPS